MIIQHNIMALNAHRQLGGNTGMVSKNLEKLSSGYKINRAGDDAAGLAISEKMRAQIKGLDRAKLNAQDGISLVQTAEGALTETHSMLNRLVELATESANGTIKDDDRGKVQDEVKALIAEIDRISDATNFNDIKLLNGELGSNIKVETIAAAGATPATASTATFDMGAFKTALDAALAAAGEAAGDYTAAGNTATMTVLGQTVTVSNAINNTSTFEDVIKDIAGQITGNGYTATAAGATITLKSNTTGVMADPSLSMLSGGGTTITTAGVWKSGAAASTGVAKTEITLREQPTAGGTIKINGTTYEFVAAVGDVKAGNTAVVIGADAATTAAALNTAMGGNLGTAASAIDADGKITITAADSTAITAEAANVGGGLTMQVGDTNDLYNKVTVSVENMSSKGLGIDGLNLATQVGAGEALATIKTAVGRVSSARSTLGALQNRLEHTINNLGVTSENMTAAESRIRDVDMASEMMTFTKNNVLTQAAQAMLAQANQQPQQVLQLLR